MYLYLYYTLSLTLRLEHSMGLPQSITELIKFFLNRWSYVCGSPINTLFNYINLRLLRANTHIITTLEI